MTTSALPIILLAPGAGAGCSSAWMQAWQRRLSTIGTAESFDYPYRLQGRKAPDKLPVLMAAHRIAIQAARGRHPETGRTVLAGKSMGGRIGCHVALEEPVDALVCLGYPLRGTTGALRDEVLLALRTPVLFVQGTRDPLCPLDALADVRARMSCDNELVVVEGGNHSLEVPRPRGARAAGAGSRRGIEGDTDGAAAAAAIDPQAISDERVLQSIAAFVSRILAR